MGKDVRGIERGKCACGECEDFMRSDGATCDGTSAAGTSESTSPEKWKDEDLG